MVPAIIEITDKQILKAYKLDDIKKLFEQFLKNKLYEDIEDSYVEFGEIAYKDLPPSAKKSIDRYRSNPESFNFVNVKDYLGLNK